MDETEKQGSDGHKPALIVLVFSTCLSFLLCISINVFAGQLGIDAGVFLNNTGEISDKYFLPITPAGWTFSVWGFIYVWQVLWLIYAITTVFRKSPTTGYLYITPRIIPNSVYPLYIVNMFLNFSWLFLFDRQWMIPALFVIMLTPATLIGCLIACCFHLDTVTDYLTVHKKTAEIWMLRMFVHNGLAFYLGWVTVATLLNLGIVLSYWGGMTPAAAGAVSLGVLVVDVIAIFVLEQFVFVSYLRYTFAQWLTVIIALSGSINKNYNSTTPTSNDIITALLLFLALVALGLKIFRMFYVRKNKAATAPLTTEF